MITANPPQLLLAISVRLRSFVCNLHAPVRVTAGKSWGMLIYGEMSFSEAPASRQPRISTPFLIRFRARGHDYPLAHGPSRRVGEKAWTDRHSTIAVVSSFSSSFCLRDNSQMLCCPYHCQASFCLCFPRRLRTILSNEIRGCPPPTTMHTLCQYTTDTLVRPWVLDHLQARTL